MKRSQLNITTKTMSFVYHLRAEENVISQNFTRIPKLIKEFVAKVFWTGETEMWSMLCAWQDRGQIAGKEGDIGPAFHQFIF